MRALAAVAVLCVGVAAGELPPVVRHALTFVPEVRPDQVVVIAGVEALEHILKERGYDSEVVLETIEEVKGLAEFTIDHRFPIFINASSYHYRRIEASFSRGRYPEQAARILASDLYHEYRHAALFEEEIEALTAHVALLEKWRFEGLLTIADPYIQAKAAELRFLRETAKRK